MAHKFYLIATSFFLASLMVSSATATNWMDDYTEECVEKGRPGIRGSSTDEGCYKQLDDTGKCYAVTLIRANVAHMYNSNNGSMSSNISSRSRSGKKKSYGSFENECSPYYLCTPRVVLGTGKALKWEKYETFESVQEWHDHEKPGWLINQVDISKCPKS